LPVGTQRLAGLPGEGFRFEQVLHRNQRPAREDPPLPERGEREPEEGPARFGPDDGEQGILRHPYTPGDFPFRVYRRNGITQQHDLNAQLAATPQLDPRPFGLRPGASPGADRRIHQGDEIVVLDEVRLNYLEQQRGILNSIRQPGMTDHEQEQRLEDLKVSIFEELDYASLPQAVPNADDLVETLAARAPEDPLWQQAVREVRGDLERMWQAQGRTEDQIGALLAAGERGDFAQVRALTEQQLIEVGDATARELGAQATPQAIAAAIDARLTWYKTYTVNDPRHGQALEQGAADAKDEIFVERAIQQVLTAAEPDGMDGAVAGMAKLREVTGREAMPEHVQAIVSDPRIAALMRRSFSSATHWVDIQNPEPGTEWVVEELDGRIDPFYMNTADQLQVIRDLAAVSQNALYADGPTPGRGKQAVDALARYVNDVASEDVFGRYDPDTRHWVEGTEGFEQPLAEAAKDGNIGLGLAITAEAVERGNGALSTYAMQGTNQGLIEFNNDLAARMGEAQQNALQLIVPLHDLGATLSDEEKVAKMAEMLNANPDLKAKLEVDGRAITDFQERAQSIHLAMDRYQGDLQGVPGFDVDIAVTDRMGVMEPRNLAAQVAALPMPEVPVQNHLWYLRSVRLLTTWGTVEALKKFLPDGPLRGAVVGNNGRGPQILPRASWGWSTALFISNGQYAQSLPDWYDKLYMFHYAMAVQQAWTALPKADWMRSFWGLNGYGEANTINRRIYDAATQHIDNMRVSGATKGFLHRLNAGNLHLVRGTVLAPLDAGYTVIDGINSVVYFSQGDWVRGLAYGASAMGDAAFMIGATTAARTAATGAAATTLGLSATAWSGVGAALLVLASGINYYKGRHEKAHQFDEANTNFLMSLGVRNRDVAHALVEGKTIRFDLDAPWRGFPAYHADLEAHSSAGRLLMTAFDRAGFTTEEAVAMINRWTPEQAGDLAEYIKHNTDLAEGETIYSDEDYARVERWAEEHGIPYPTR
jgi:hypothetical protein